MSNAVDVEKQIKSIVSDAAKKLNLNKYTTDLNLNVLKGDGFLGEFYKVSITDNKNSSTIHLAIKRAPTAKIRREQNFIDLVYQNEIFFYTEIIPAFRRFEQENQVSKPFDSVAKYYASNSQIGSEILAFQDITKEGYILREKNLLLDDKHARLIFETYGHYHAISFCMKEKKPDEFARLTKPLHNIWNHFSETNGFLDYLVTALIETQDSLDPNTDGIIIEKFRKYVENTKKEFQESCVYKGQYFGIVHGDCWSNNMMFKYQDPNDTTDVQSIKLLDFQLVVASTPVHDLSYFFYTGGSKELFDKLEVFLDIYYRSFSTIAKELGYDANILLPREIINQDWKKYARFGMMLSTMLTKVKLTSKEESIKVIEAADNQKEGDTAEFDAWKNLNFDRKLFKERVRDIVTHMNEIDAL